MKVMKFGGAVLRDAATVLKAVEVIVSHQAERITVVVSALSGVTDSLHQMLKEVEENEKAIRPLMAGLKKQHEEMVSGLISDKKILTEALAELKNKMAKLERVLYGIAYTEEVTDRTRDYVVSFGERLSAPILAASLRDKGLSSIAFNADEIGLITNGAFGRATALLSEVESNLQKTIKPQIEKGAVPVITGYFGCDRDGRAVTFGRGGSDYSAAIIAYALKAEVLEVWKDVPGFMSADPKVVKEARGIPLMSYQEAAELAYFGAKVLHPRIVEPSMMRGIPIRVKNLFAPNEEGTLIQEVKEKSEWVVRSVAMRPGLSLVNLAGPAMAYTPGLAGRVFTALSSAGVNVYTMAASMASFSVIVDAQDVRGALNSLRGMKEGGIQDISTTGDISLICIVGKGLRETRGIAAKAFTAIAKAGVNVELISDGGSDVALTFVIKSPDSSKAMKALHEEFIK